ncbi:Myosin essential light chain striated adductor muscle [Paragonimus skrjabini miyazakii]|uniref:Myosin essential light chain striated adductor muscle n=2 Tax=Paragonimus TaxID=34503 RepID=A0A8S9YWI3_9TREM|nr:Myosin essential light chain striated adductor muscle [Paragonimus skrjabini miyazakii]
MVRAINKLGACPYLQVCLSYSSYYIGLNFRFTNAYRSIGSIIMSTLSKAEVEDIREVFDLFDFWDGRDGMIDAVKVGDLLRCSGINPTIALTVKHGATTKQGEKQYKFDEFLPCYEAILKEKETGTFADYMEAYKTFDREGQGFISAAEMRHVLTGYGERLDDKEVDQIVKFIDLHEDLDGNIKYEELIKRVLAGPSTK